ncbi:hypothetical protein L596_004773 [Steinernema carpocapsae]|uniref:Uncharacterized protein n=1 Tax=Steinernema carpocapsae TaxID=34508 RepID=A0A4U8UWU2_STECR|nr:hypothetical protein L596_004773 [Steinernema carpocapsae]
MFRSATTLFCCLLILFSLTHGEEEVTIHAADHQATDSAVVEDKRDVAAVTHNAEIEKRHAGHEDSAESHDESTVAVVAEVLKREAEHESAEKEEETPEEHEEQHSGEHAVEKRDVFDEDSVNDVTKEDENLVKRETKHEESAETSPAAEAEELRDRRGAEATLELEPSRARRYAAPDSVGALREKRVSRAGSSHKARPSAISRAHNTNSNVGEAQPNEEEEGEDTEGEYD